MRSRGQERCRLLGQLGASGPAVLRMWLWLLGRIPPDLAPRDSGTSRGRSWFGKQLATGTCPRCSLSVSQEGWALTRGAAQGKRGHCPFPSPTTHRLWAHAMGLAPKIPQVPPVLHPWHSHLPDLGGWSFLTADTHRDFRAG